MSAASILDSMVSVTSLNHGRASKALSQVGDNHPVVALKNNQPSAVIVTPADYRRLTQAEENFALYRKAVERLRNDDSTLLTDETYSAKIMSRLMTVLNQNSNKVHQQPASGQFCIF